MKPKIIAFYLPQYHPFPENDRWWGKGFTEWTNVCRAKPLFKGHYQPKIPADLGFYDLRLPDVREQQAKMAEEAGIYGFCYWHYWFNGHELMQMPFDEVVESGKPDYPFCVGWANESWQSKLWNKDGSVAGGKMLIKQTYSENDDIRHFNKLLNTFKDKRYIKIDGKPLVFIHRGMLLPKHVITNWNNLARENGLPGIFFIGRISEVDDKRHTDYLTLKSEGFDGVTFSRLGNSLDNQSIIQKVFRHLKGYIRYRGCVAVTTYSKDMKGWFHKEVDCNDDVFPEIYSNWDHSPRSGRRGVILNHSTPELFKKALIELLNLIKRKPEDKQICFIKSWNEWGEGNYLEPDLKYGKKYLNIIKEISKEL